MEIVMTLEDRNPKHLERAVGAAEEYDTDILVVWSGQHGKIVNQVREALRLGISVYMYYCYEHPIWPVDSLVWERQRKSVLDHHELASSSHWITNSFSNFFPFKVPMEYKGLKFHTPENYYQAMKSRDPIYREKIASLPPGKAKRLSRDVGTIISQRANWDRIKFKVMFAIQRHRVLTDPDFRDWLIGTYGQPIIEWSNWGDTYWGMDIDTCEGENWLGRTLMLIRDYDI